MGKLATVTHDGSEITLTMIRWGGVRRWMLSKTLGPEAPAQFVPEYEIAVYEGSPKVVVSKNPTFKFFYRDKETALEKWDELVAIIRLGGVYGDEIGKFIRDGDPQKQGILASLPSLQERLGKSLGLLNDSGSAYANNGQYDRVIAEFDETIRLDPNYTQAISSRAEIVAKKNELDGSADENGSVAKAAWEKTFRGKTNTNDVLDEKAETVVRFIIQNCDSALTVAVALKDTTPDIRLGEVEERQARAETAALLLTLVDRIAVCFFDSEKRNVFMDALEIGVVGALQDKGVEAEAFHELLYKRYEEYSQYPKWVHKEGEAAKGTLFWEFGKKVASILCIGQNILFQAILTKLLLENFDSWNLDKLLPEQG